MISISIIATMKNIKLIRKLKIIGMDRHNGIRATE